METRVRATLPLRTIIWLQQRGSVGNRAIQYVAARRLQRMVPESLLRGYDIPTFGIRCNQKRPDTFDLRVDKDHIIDLNRLAYLLNSRIITSISLRSYMQRMEYLGEVDTARSLVNHLYHDIKEEFGTHNDIVINIRGAEVMTGLHPDYTPLPLVFYEQIVSETRLSPIFIGQIDDSRYFQELRKRFTYARFVQSTSPLADFQKLTMSKHIVCSVSSFSWLAAWLSPTVDSIHLPVCGLFNPAQRPDIDLLPHDDVRYRYYEFPVKKFKGSDEDFDGLLSSAQLARTMDTTEIKKNKLTSISKFL